MKHLLCLFSCLLISFTLFADCTVYYAGAFTSPKAYAWTSGNEMSWPGQAMTATSYTYGGNPVYTITFTTNYQNIIFNNGGSQKTADLTMQCGKLYTGSAWVAYTPGDTAAVVPATDPEDLLPLDPNMSNQLLAPAESEDVMRQGFYWDSNTLTTYGRTKWIDFKNNGYASQIAAAGFTIVWLPSPVASSGGLGYHPTCWSSFDSGLGTKTNLKLLVDSLHLFGVKAMADIVVNHRGNSSGWCTFAADNFGANYGSDLQPNGNYQFSNNHIVSDDEAISGGHCTTTGNPDSGIEAYAGARDLDHTNPYVRAAVCSYLAFLQGEIGFDGWRYDLVKGYAPRYLAHYNRSSLPYMSVGEYFDGNLANLEGFIDATDHCTMLFDFAAKFSAFNQGIAADSYGKLKQTQGNKLHRDPAYSRYAVTFIDNHDTFCRNDLGGNEFKDNTSSGQSLANSNNHKKVLEANAYLLSMPGVPCVFWPHWRTFPTQISQMIAARKLVGIHSESQVVSEETGGPYKYSATVEGHRGSLIVRLGSSRDTSTPDGYTLYTSGDLYSIFVKVNPTALEQTTVTDVHKVMRDGRILILRDGQTYDMLGRIVE